MLTGGSTTSRDSRFEQYTHAADICQLNCFVQNVRGNTEIVVHQGLDFLGQRKSTAHLDILLLNGMRSMLYIACRCFCNTKAAQKHQDHGESTDRMCLQMQTR